MKSTNIYFALMVIVSFLFFSCAGEFVPSEGLNEVTLIAPENNQECFGINLPNGKIRVSFDWEGASSETSYTLEYEETTSGNTFTETSADSNIDLELEPGTQFSWKVTVVDDTGNSRTSDTFNFYTEGLAEENHVPFPAVVDFSNNGNGTLTFSWNGSDLDGDIQFYDVFFSDQTPPAQLLSQTTTTSRTVNIITGNTYYLNVKTVDRNGNFSDSKKTITIP